MNRISRGTAFAALVAGLSWIAKDLGGRFSPDPDYWDCNSSYDYALNATDTVAFLLLVPVLLGLYGAYRASTEAKHGVTALGSAGSFGVAGVSNLLEHCAGMDILGFAYVIGVVFAFLLLFVFAVALTQVQLIPRASSWLLVVGTAVGLLMANQGGFIVFGVAWTLLACVLLFRPTSPRRP